ncbi:MAG TPA: hypothetical protein VKE74_25835 [Gemmataceae bacterium]|nr:hypothetical protein [Gemmataceae bacterium]
MPRTVPIAASTLGAGNTIVAGVTGQIVRVLGFHLSFSGAVNAKFQSNGTMDLSGLFYGGTGVQVPGADLPTFEHGKPPAYFETLSGEPLTLNLSAGVAVGGFVHYELLLASLAQQ